MSDHRRTHQDPANAALGLTAIAAVDNHDEDCFRLGTKVISGQDYRMITFDEAPYPDTQQAQQAHRREDRTTSGRRSGTSGPVHPIRYVATWVRNRSPVPA